MDLNPSSSLSHEHPPGSLCANPPQASQPRQNAAQCIPMSLPPATEGTGPGPESSPQLGHMWEPESLVAPREAWNYCLNPSQPRAQPRTSPALNQIPNHIFTNRNTKNGLFEFTKYSSTHITSFDQFPGLTDFPGLLLCTGTGHMKWSPCLCDDSQTTRLPLPAPFHIGIIFMPIDR